MHTAISVGNTKGAVVEHSKLIMNILNSQAGDEVKKKALEVVAELNKIDISIANCQFG